MNEVCRMRHEHYTLDYYYIYVCSHLRGAELRARTGFDWASEVRCAGQRAAWLCKNAEIYNCQR